MKVMVDIPDTLADVLAGADRDVGRTLLEDFVAQLYREGRIGTRQLREVLGLSWHEKEAFFLRHHICYETTADEILADAERSRQTREGHDTEMAAA